MKRSYKNVMDKCYDFDWYDTKNGKKFQKKIGHKRLRNEGDKDISERNETDDSTGMD